MKMNNRGLSVVLLIVIILAVAGGIFLLVRQTQQKTAGGGGNETITGNNVEIKDSTFSPGTLTISAGDTITWTNTGSALHRIVSDTGSELNSSILSNGGIYSHTFSTTGSFAYHCAIHTYMKGTIIVE